MNYKELSKYLSYLLRHNPKDANLNMDKNGWVSVQELITNTCNFGKTKRFTLEILEYIVSNDNKCRYKFNEDKTKIRANQGHSINIDLELKEVVPEGNLYHGTATRFVDSIMKYGIKSQNRQYVHLSSDIEKALEVGKRHGDPIVLEIDVEKMVNDGIKFYLSENDVWLTEYVDNKYIRRKL